MRTNRGRHGFWPAMRASTDRRRGTNASPAWCKAQCAKILGQEEISTRCAIYPSPRRRRICRPSSRRARDLRARAARATRLRCGFVYGLAAAAQRDLVERLRRSLKANGCSMMRHSLAQEAGTFAALAPIYREIDDPPSS